jgi:hypothetical protein
LSGAVVAEAGTGTNRHPAAFSRCGTDAAAQEETGAMCTAKEYDRALLDPAAVFKLPKDVLNSDALTTEQKLELLKRWETDALLLSVADEENMGGGEPSRIEDVRHAIDTLTRLEDIREPAD